MHLLLAFFQKVTPMDHWARDLVLAPLSKAVSVAFPIPYFSAQRGLTRFSQAILGDYFLEKIVEIVGQCLNQAFENSSAEKTDSGRIFSARNWMKARESQKAIRANVRTYLGAIKFLPGGKELMAQSTLGLAMEPSDFESRWSAD